MKEGFGKFRTGTLLRPLSLTYFLHHAGIKAMRYLRIYPVFERTEEDTNDGHAAVFGITQPAYRRDPRHAY